jgi:SAM-dependent methyltransferase
MEYEPKYSRNQVHFISQPPEWLSLVDGMRQVDSILDLGAGGGRNSVYLRRLYPRAEITAIDISPIRCSACHDAVGVEVVCGDALGLPFRTESFDFVISTAVIEHVPNDVFFVDEIERVLRPGGVTLVSSVIRMRLGWYFYRNRKGEWMLDPTHLREYRSLEQFTALFDGRFRIMWTITKRFGFSPVRFLYRLMIRLEVIREPDPRFLSETRIGRLLGRLLVPIPRYRHVILLAERL